MESAKDVLKVMESEIQDTTQPSVTMGDIQ